MRSYVAVGLNKRGRRGAFSTRVLLPVGAAPTAPEKPMVAWDENTITITWSAVPAAEGQLSYHVYVPGNTETQTVETRLTEAPLAEAQFADRRIEWGAERCYLVRSVVATENLTVESDASPATCVTLVDTFPPAAPTGLTTVPASGAVNLIWNQNTEKDLAGYIVLRAVAPETNLAPVTPESIVAATFTDAVPAGARVSYAIRAVDKAGNTSPMSAIVEETAR